MTIIAPVPGVVEAACEQWREGYVRFLEMAEEPSSRERLYLQLEIVSDELRRRIGQTFTLAEAVEQYQSAERWAFEQIAERSPGKDWAQTLAMVLDASFFLYSRTAVDYAP